MSSNPNIVELNIMEQNDIVWNVTKQNIVRRYLEPNVKEQQYVKWNVMQWNVIARRVVPL